MNRKLRRQEIVKNVRIIGKPVKIKAGKPRLRRLWPYNGGNGQ
jgi:hypothetical protein